MGATTKSISGKMQLLHLLLLTKKATMRTRRTSLNSSRLKESVGIDGLVVTLKALDKLGINTLVGVRSVFVGDLDKVVTDI